MSHNQVPWSGGLGPHPAPGDSVGRYRLREQVGAGGLATVFRAVDGRGADVAVKILNPARVLPEEVKRFTREYRALSRMDHENIVKVYEAGVHEGYPWIAMEFVNGTDLDTEIARWKAEDPPDRWVRVDRVLRGLCRGLAYIHDHGLIHRDLKPSNVLLTRAGEPKISDFGVVKGDNTHTTQLTMAGRLVGTVAFMAPELITDEGVDRRADLYALGAVLYLMCTYRRPIEADSVAGYLARHLTEIPQPVGELDPGAPAILERLCARLLQKDRVYRYPSALAVLQALDRPEDPDAPPLRGRDEVLSTVNRHLQALLDGRGGTIALVGPPGAGQTHLLRYIEDQARGQGLAVASASGRSDPLADLARALDLDGPDALSARLDEQPTVLLIDDLDRALPEQIFALTALVRQRLVIDCASALLVFATTDLEGEAASLAAAAGGSSELVELGPVEPKSVIAMLRDRGATGPVAPLLARRLHADYGGMPGPMMSQVEALIREGWLARAGDVLRPVRPLDDFRRADLPVPQKVRERIVAELDALDAASREMCEMLAILDRPGAPALLERCCPDDHDATRRIERLVKQRVLLRATIEPEQEEVRLADPCMARVIRSRLAPGRQRQLHAAVAEALAARRRRANALEVARHLRAAGDEAAAYPLYVTAARRAAREGRFGEVLDICDAAEQVRVAGEAALPAAERPRALLWLQLLRGEALLARRAWEEAVGPLQVAVGAARRDGEPGAVARSLGALGRAHYRAGRYAEAEPLLREALQHAARSTPERSGALRALADISLRAGRLGDAESLWNDAMFAATDAGDRNAEARARRGLAHLRAVQGRLIDAVALLDQADDLLSSDLDYRVRAGILARAIELDTAAGRFGSAVYRAEGLVELARRHGMGERLPEAYALLADLLLRLGEVVEAEDAAQQSLVFAKATEGAGWDPRLRAARVLADLGRFHDAFAALPPAEEVPPSPVDDPPAQFAAISARLYARTEPERARDLAAWALNRPPPLLLLTGTRIAQDAALALLELGQVEAGRNALKRGLKLLGAPGSVHASEGIRLELLIGMQRASPDPRVVEAIRRLVDELLAAVPPNALPTFRARPEIQEALGGSGS